MRSGISRERREVPLARLGWLITAATLLPFLLLTGAGVVYWLQEQQKDEHERLIRRAEALARAVDRELRVHIGTAQLLAMSQRLRAGDWTSFESLARDAAAMGKGHFILVDRYARQIVNSRADPGSVVPPTDNPVAMAQMPGMTEPTVTDLSSDPGTRNYRFTVRVPVVLDGQVQYVLVYAPPPAAILDVVKEHYLPEGWFATVLDSAGRIVARSEHHDTFYGQAATYGFVRQLNSAEKLIESTDLEGRQSLTAFQRSEISGWRTIVWAPKAVITGPIEQAKKWAIGIVVLTAAAASAAAWLSGRAVRAAAQRLVEAAHALGAGHPVEFEPTTVKEVNITGRALVDASQSIAAREQALRLSEAWFSAAFRLAPIPMAVATIGEGRQVAVNEARLKLTGHSLDEIIGKTPREIGFYFDHDRDYARLRRGLAQNSEIIAEEFELRRKNGERYTGLISAASIPLNDIPHLLAIIVDITERKRAEEHTQLLLREVNHRSKNLLAVAQALARHSAKATEPSLFVTRFTDRLRALAASHDLVVGSEWHGVELGALVRTQIEHFQDAIGERISLAGPSIKIRAAAAQAIGMALHELATNAAKYGALSKVDGRVEVTWNLEACQGGTRFRMSWREKGGPTVEPPSKSGFGRTVIVDLIQSAVHGSARLDFATDGLFWELTAPWDEVAESAVTVTEVT